MPGFVFLTLSLFAIGAHYFALKFPGLREQKISQAQLFDWIDEGRVTGLVNEPEPSDGIYYLTGTYHKPDANGGLVYFKVPVDHSLDSLLLSQIKSEGYAAPIGTSRIITGWVPIIINFVPILLFLAVLGLMAGRLFVMR